MEEVTLIKKKENENEKRKKKGAFFLFGKRVRIGRVLLLLVALIGLSTSTYAWFTSNLTVSVQEIDVHVSSGSGIQISTNASDWKSMITLTDIRTNKYSAAVNQVPATTDQINPVSTTKAVNESATSKSDGLYMFRGNIVNDVRDGTMYLDTTALTDGSNTDYVAFDLFLKLDFNGTGTKQVYLTPETGITAGSPNTHIEYAGRMAFVIQGSAASSTTAADLQEIKGHTSVLFYEPNYDVHTDNGLANGRNNYALPNTVTATNNQSPVAYWGVKAAFAYDSTAYDAQTGVNTTGTTLNSHDTNKFTQVTPDILTTEANSHRTAFAQLPIGVTKIRVYMWIEGQDIDCENTASGGEVKFNLGFTIDDPTASS